MDTKKRRRETRGRSDSYVGSLEKVPLHIFSWEGLSFITITVGFSVKLHLETITCTNFEVAKVFFHADISKVLEGRQAVYSGFLLSMVAGKMQTMR